MLSLAMIEPGCSSRKDSLPEVGSAEDYLAQRQTNAYASGYGPYDLCAAYDPYCFAPNWYPLPVYYFPVTDGDNACDDGKCHGSGGGGHPKRPRDSGAGNLAAMATPSSTSAALEHGPGAPSMLTAHFGASFDRGGFGGQGRR
jgi:hypothetical protein